MSKAGDARPIMMSRRVVSARRDGYQRQLLPVTKNINEKESNIRLTSCFRRRATDRDKLKR